VTTLAGLLTRSKRREEARAMLTEVCIWFTDGLETADLTNATAQLIALTAWRFRPASR
jgi:hypothetical protein